MQPSPTVDTQSTTMSLPLCDWCRAQATHSFPRPTDARRNAYTCDSHFETRGPSRWEYQWLMAEYGRKTLYGDTHPEVQ